MWALGCIIYHLITGNPFMDVKNIEDLVQTRYEYKKLSKVDPTLKKKISPEFYDFLKNLLRKKGRTRMTIKEAFKHKFIVEGVAHRSAVVIPY
jgi:serine/threonine protein kinase